ncbi:MAG: translocation/assembly module TamB domain-containing protein [Neisseria sp.]|uniref:translocation/assembly module TamB domain-containing protein n=1 Tax=Neisseria sp. TaxID=192066 RepID=UPI0026DD9B08|nr:translocation/assembly module TamB domain-containing protein [Neisseria sp.]MDO4641676.1 translocation/assembly module TamB domain-containing protein [Neisseria sp.]
MTQEIQAPNPSSLNQSLSEKPPAPKKRGKKWLKAILLFFVLAVLVLGGVITWLVATESGLRFGLYKIPAWFGVNITSKTLKGTLIKGFSGEGWRVETTGADIDITSFVFDWQPGELRDKKLHIRRLAAGDIHIQGKPTPPTPKTETKMPGSVSLPIEAAIDSLETGQITSGKNKTVLVRQVQLSYLYDHKQHALNILSLKSPWSDAVGSIKLATASPFALNGSIHSEGALENIAIKNRILINGSLKSINLDTDMRTVVGKQDTAESGARANDIKLTVNTHISPFGKGLDEIINNVQVKGENINPQAFFASAPQAHFDFDATVVPSDLNGIALEGSIDLANRSAAEADAGGIPVRSLLADFTVNQHGVLLLENADAELLKKGKFVFSGNTDTEKQTFNLDADIQQVVLADLIKQSFAEPINGKLKLRGDYSNPQALLDLTVGKTAAQGEVALVSDVKNGQRSVDLKSLSIKPENGGEISGKGNLALFDKQNLAFELTSKNFNPARLYADLPAGSINGDFKVNGRLSENYIAGNLHFGQSMLSNVVLSGKADVIYDKNHLSKIASNIQLGSNRLFANGSFGKQGDRLTLDVNAPDLARFGFGMGGLLVAKGTLAGDPKRLEADIAGRAENLRIQKAVQINHLDFQVKGSPDINRPFNIKADGKQIVIPGEKEPTRIDNVQLTVNGTGKNHSIKGNGSMRLDGKPYHLLLSADGGLNEKNQWKGYVDALDINGAFNLKLQNRLNLEAGAERVSLSAARWSAMGGSLNLQNFIWDKKQGITTKGSADNLNMAQLHNFYTPPVEHNLVLSGDWDVVYAQNMRGYINVRRQSGDIIIPYRKQALGLSTLVLQTRFQNGRIDNIVQGTTRYGNIAGNLAISQNFGNVITQAPINGKISLNAPDLEAFRHLMPVGQVLKGRLIGEALISGRLGEPQFNGTLNGDGLYYRNHSQGVILDNGTLRSRLSGQRWQIDSLSFRRGGTATLSGDISLAANSAPDVDITAVFNQYQILDKPNRRLTISGNTKLLYNNASGVTLTGLLKADNGHFGFQDSSMPSLDDDVVVVGETKEKAAAATPVNMNLTLDLNDRFRFSGEGLDVTLGGQLVLIAKPGESVQGVGTVNVVKGKYKAYGQDLNITKGKISFVGPLDDPNLNIRATRNLSPVGAGVEVLGSLSKPRVSLVADEAMSEKDKLSWLILNRASSGNDSDEAALATAAGAFLAGKVNDKIGLVDNFGLTSQRTRNAQTGELNPAEQILTFGKQLTSELYLGYDYGITSASQSVKLIYQLSRSLQAVARVGTRSSGGELKYIIRFD